MRPGLWALLAASLAGSAWLAAQPDADTPVVPAAARPTRAGAAREAAPAAPGPAPATDGLPTRPADWPAASRLALQAWQGQTDLPGGVVAPVTAPRAAPGASAPATERAPAAVFPYRWIGQLDDGDGPAQVLLSSAQRSVGVRLGQVLDGRWRIEHDALGVLIATALPSGPAQPVPGATAGHRR